MTQPALRRLPARWGRAVRLIPPENATILDVGCAFGFLTGRLDRCYAVVGVELLWRYLQQAKRQFPNLRLVQAMGEDLPVQTASFDTVLLLDVLEHVADERRIIKELARVVQPGGTLILSVPHRGWLASLDAQNLYDDVRQHLPWFPARPDERGYHRHYSLNDMTALLAPYFTVTTVERTGLGLAEPSNFFFLVFVYGICKQPSLFRMLQYVYFTAYIIEDLLPAGRAAYHMILRAERVGSSLPNGPSVT